MTAAHAALALLLALPAAAEPPLLRVTLAQAESAAGARSPLARAAAAEAEAAAFAAESRRGALWPRLSLEGSYRYQTEIPSMALAPGQPARAFGDHRATSLGPRLTWTLWDQGALDGSWRAQRARAASAAELETLTAARVLLGARLAYAQAQLAREQTLALGDALALAEAQERDIAARFRAGSASRIDTLSARQDSLERRRQLLQAQAGFSASLRELFRITGLGEGLDASRPVDARASSAALAGLAAPSLRVELDDLREIPAALADAEKAPSDLSAHPSVLALSAQSAAAREASRAARAAGGPSVRLNASLSRDYPNGPVLESVDQKAVGLTASLPLFEGRQSARAGDEQERLAAAAEARRRDAADSLARDLDVTRAALASLREQLSVEEREAADADELARLVFLSYKEGRSRFIEVQAANLRALEARVQAAGTRAQVLARLAELAQLSVRGGSR